MPFRLNVGESRKVGFPGRPGVGAPGSRASGRVGTHNRPG